MGRDADESLRGLEAANTVAKETCVRGADGCLGERRSELMTPQITGVRALRASGEAEMICLYRPACQPCPARSFLRTHS